MPKVPVPQIRVLNYNGEEIGMGFNSDTGLAIGTALDFDPPDPNTSQEATSDVQIVTSHESLMESINMSASAEGRYGFSQVSGKVKWSNDTGYNTTSTFVVARMVIQNLVNRGRNFRIKPAVEPLLSSNQDAFGEAFGDCFVRALFKGGEFYCVLRITSVDTTTQTSLAADLAADIQAGAASATFKLHLDEANKSERTKSEFFATYFQKGGAGAEQIGSTLSVAEVQQRLHNFPDAVKQNAFPYQTEVAAYDTVPIPVPTKEQQDDFLLCLQDADSQKLKFLELRNTLKLARDSPAFFDDLPATSVLQSAVDAYTSAANAAIAHAVKLSNGTINPPQLFDITKITPPIVLPSITLKKKTVPLTAIEKKYQDMGGDNNSILGVAVDQNELASSDGVGRFKRYQHGGIYWHPAVDSNAHVVYGAFYDAYQKFGAHEGRLGFPREDRKSTNFSGIIIIDQQFKFVGQFAGGDISQGPGINYTAQNPHLQDGNMFGVYVAIEGVTTPE